MRLINMRREWSNAGSQTHTHTFHVYVCECGCVCIWLAMKKCSESLLFSRQHTGGYVADSKNQMRLSIWFKATVHFVRSNEHPQDSRVKRRNETQPQSTIIYTSEGTNERWLWPSVAIFALGPGAALLPRSMHYVSTEHQLEFYELTRDLYPGWPNKLTKRFFVIAFMIFSYACAVGLFTRQTNGLLSLFCVRNRVKSAVKLWPHSMGPWTLLVECDCTANAMGSLILRSSVHGYGWCVLGESVTGQLGIGHCNEREDN